jgi:two-component sensor histidine kinase
VKRLDGSLGWIHSRAVPVFDDDGEIVEWFGAARDVSDRKRHDETQRLLVSELSHRVKNMLAVVQAITQQTLRRAKDPADFAASFGGRIQSLSLMHGLLGQSVDSMRSSMRSCAISLPRTKHLASSCPDLRCFLNRR